MALRIDDLTATTTFVGTDEFELSLAGAAGSRKITGSNLRKQIFAGGTGFTSSNPITAGVATFTSVDVTSTITTTNGILSVDVDGPTSVAVAKFTTRSVAVPAALTSGSGSRPNGTNVAIATQAGAALEHAQLFLYTASNTFAVSGPRLALIHSEGSFASPSATVSGSSLGIVEFNGYGSTAFGFSGGASILVNATQTWTDTANGTSMSFLVTANGAATRLAALTLEQDRNATFSNGATFAAGITCTTGTFNGAVSGITTLGTTGSISGVASAHTLGAATGAIVLTLGNAAPSGDNSGGIKIISSNAVKNWHWASNAYSTGMDWTPSTANGGTTFTTPVMNLTAAGLLSAVTFKSTSTAGQIFVSSSATTGNAYVQISNTSGQMFLGLESSAGGTIVTGASAYDSVITGLTGLVLSGDNGSTVGFRLTATTAVLNTSIKTAAPAGGTAAAWKLGTVSVTSPTSPNRTIELDVAGTIYYLAAKTTNN